MNHYRGRVATWDVVNEALADDGSPRDCIWRRVIGADWVEQAFRIARGADPGSRLFYNEVRADVPNPKYEAMLSMARDFKTRGVPLDGVGLQYHLAENQPTQAQMEEGDPPPRRARPRGAHQRAGRADLVPRAAHDPGAARGSAGDLPQGRHRLSGAAGLLPGSRPGGSPTASPIAAATRSRCRSTRSTGRSRPGPCCRRCCAPAVPTRPPSSACPTAPAPAPLQQATAAARGPLSLAARVKRQRLRTYAAPPRARGEAAG